MKNAVKYLQPTAGSNNIFSCLPPLHAPHSSSWPPHTLLCNQRRCRTPRRQRHNVNKPPFGFGAQLSGLHCMSDLIVLKARSRFASSATLPLHTAQHISWTANRQHFRFRFTHAHSRAEGWAGSGTWQQYVATMALKNLCDLSSKLQSECGESWFTICCQ